MLVILGGENYHYSGLWVVYGSHADEPFVLVLFPAV